MAQISAKIPRLLKTAAVSILTAILFSAVLSFLPVPIAEVIRIGSDVRTVVKDAPEVKRVVIEYLNSQPNKQPADDSCYSMPKCLAINAAYYH